MDCLLKIEIDVSMRLTWLYFFQDCPFADPTEPDSFGGLTESSTETTEEPRLPEGRDRAADRIHRVGQLRRLAEKGSRKEVHHRDDQVTKRR